MLHSVDFNNYISDAPKTVAKVDKLELRRLLHGIEHAESFALAEQAVVKISRVLGLPVIAWCPDVSIPHYNAHMDEFMLRNGWPEATMKLWWDHAVMLKHPIYLNCRIKALPFVFDMSAGTATDLADVRKINLDVVDRNVRSSITIPIRLPRGQVAMLFFGGPKSTEDTFRILEQTRSELISAGQYFMNIYLKETCQESHNQELLWRLTPKQWECLRLSAQGYRETEIAEIMGIVTPTVRYHLKNATNNIGASTRSHAIAIAAQLGMLGPISI